MAEPSTVSPEPRAQKALSASPIFALRELKVERCDGALLISGSVNSFYHKQVAQEVVRAVANGLEVINSVVVRTDGLEE